MKLTLYVEEGPLDERDPNPLFREDACPAVSRIMVDGDDVNYAIKSGQEIKKITYKYYIEHWCMNGIIVIMLSS